MNTISISSARDFESIFLSEVIVTGNQNLWKQEISNNMWCLDLLEEGVKNVTLEHLSTFIDDLLNIRRKQILSSNQPKGVVFYLWFDEQTAQLRFNFLSDCDRDLPFGCTLHYVDKPETILMSFLDSHYHEAIAWSELAFEPLDENESDDWDEPEEPYILPIYKICLCDQNS